MPTVHPSAVVDPSAILADDVQVGPQAFIDADVVIGPGCRILHGVHIGRWTTLGSGNILYPGAVVGHDPQDLGYKGEVAFTEIGNGNVIREGCTIHRGNREGTRTVVGDGNYFMVNSHVAHNCIVGSRVILVNGSLLAGHVEVEDRVIVSGNCQVHQFVRIGTLAMMRGGSGTSKDIPPYCIHDGVNRVRALNLVGLRRNGVDAARIRSLQRAFRLIFRSGLRQEEALVRVEEEVERTPEVTRLVSFIRSSRRGVCSGRRSGRGED